MRATDKDKSVGRNVYGRTPSTEVTCRNTRPNVRGNPNVTRSLPWLRAIRGGARYLASLLVQEAAKHLLKLHGKKLRITISKKDTGRKAVEEEKTLSTREEKEEVPD